MDKNQLNSASDYEKYKDTKLIHICEKCGKQMLLTPDEGFEAGWDYAPKMYPFGIVSPRTCGDCTMEDTVWAAIVLENKPIHELTAKQKEAINRILNEPDSILPE